MPSTQYRSYRRASYHPCPMVFHHEGNSNSSHRGQQTPAPKGHDRPPAPRTAPLPFPALTSGAPQTRRPRPDSTSHRLSPCNGVHCHCSGHTEPIRVTVSASTVRPPDPPVSSSTNDRSLLLPLFDADIHWRSIDPVPRVRDESADRPQFYTGAGPDRPHPQIPSPASTRSEAIGRSVRCPGATRSSSCRTTHNPDELRCEKSGGRQ